MSTVSSTNSTSTNPYLVSYSLTDVMDDPLLDSTKSGNSSSSSSSTSSTSSSGKYSQSLVSQMSGIDVNSMVDEAMAGDYAQLNQLLSKKQISQWTQDRYRSIISNLNDFSGKYFDITSADNVTSASNYLINAAQSSAPAYVNATALNTAKQGNYILTINNAASATKMGYTPTTSNGTGLKASGITNSSSLSSLLTAEGLPTTGTLTFNVNGNTVSYDLSQSSSTTVSQFMNQITSKSGVNGAVFSYSELTGQTTITNAVSGASNLSLCSTDASSQAVLNKLFGTSLSSSAATAANAPGFSTGATVTNGVNSASVSYGPANTTGITSTSKLSDLLSKEGLPTTGTLTFNVNGTAVNYDLTSNPNATVSDFMAAIGSKGVTFGYDQTTGKTSITNSNGTNISVSSSDTSTQNVLNALFGTSLSSGTTTASVNGSSALGSAAMTTGGAASVTITEPDGSTATITPSSNNFTIDGVNYNISNGTPANTPVTINVSQDTSSIVSKLQDFVDSYNDLISGLNTAVTEKRDYSYKPLTSAQQSQMSASAITAWNQKAQQGLLQNDDIITGLMSSMRTALYTPVSGTSLTMGDIGLSTSDDPTDGGKLTLNVSKLTSALQSNPQGVIDLLTKTSTSVPAYSTTLTNAQMATRNSEEGIFQRLHDIKQQYANDVTNDGILIDKAGSPGSSSTDTTSSLYKELKDESDSITQFELRVKNDKTRYTTQFTSLQSALSQLSTQQNYLSSMLSSSSN